MFVAICNPQYKNLLDLAWQKGSDIFGIKTTNFFQQVLKPLGSYMRFLLYMKRFSCGWDSFLVYKAALCKRFCSRVENEKYVSGFFPDRRVSLKVTL